MGKKNLFEGSAPVVESTKSTAVAQADVKSTAVATLDEIQAMFDPAENLKDETPDIPLIKVLPQAQMFLLPDETKIDAVQGVVVETYRCNAWWDPTDSQENNRPACSSLNDLTPLPDSPKPQSTHCATCKQNLYGSALDANGKPQSGKACKNMRRMYVLMAGHEFPYMLSLSPTSMKSGKRYLTQLSDKGRNIATVETKITLSKMTKGSNVYSVAEMETVREINDPETLNDILKVKRQIAQLAKTQAITGAEYETTDENLDALIQRPGDKF